MSQVLPSVGPAYWDSRRDSISRLEFYEITKRLLDILGASLGLICLSPLLLLIWGVIKVTHGGPVIFTQTRVGKNGKEFRFHKFRSMVPEAPRMQIALQSASQHGDQRTFKIPDDPRITWFGRLLRRSSMDELPQLWNVLRGEMSLVGPRPPVPSEVARYTPQDWERLRVVPGLTGYWQVYGRGDLPFSEQLVLDLEYIKVRSIWTDIKILMLTIPAVLSCRGAY